MPKIVLVNGSFMQQRIAGVQRYAFELLRAMAKIQQDKYAWLVVVPGDKRDVINDVPGVEVLFDKTMLPVPLWIQTRLPFLAAKLKIDVLWSPANIAPIFCALPQVVTVFDGSVYHDKDWFNWKFRNYYRAVFGMYRYSADRIVTCSSFSREEIVAYLRVPRNKVDVVYGAISGGFSHMGDSPRLGYKYVLSLGSRDPRKNVSSLVDAWRTIPAEIKKGIKLVIAGGGNRNFSDESLQSSGRDVVFLGYVPDRDLPLLYSNAECFVYPSFYEGFGLPPLEAMSCGCPVVVSTAASLPEVCGDAALYVEPKDTAGIAARICDLISNVRLKNDLISKGYANVKRFDWGASAIEMLRVFDQII